MRFLKFQVRHGIRGAIGGSEDKIARAEEILAATKTNIDKVAVTKFKNLENVLRRRK